MVVYYVGYSKHTILTPMNVSTKYEAARDTVMLFKIAVMAEKAVMAIPTPKVTGTNLKD